MPQPRPVPQLAGVALIENDREGMTCIYQTQQGWHRLTGVGQSAALAGSGLQDPLPALPAPPAPPTCTPPRTNITRVACILS